MHQSRMWPLQKPFPVSAGRAPAGVLQTIFRPFSCKGFSLCPSCSQKRTLLFAEHLTSEVLLDLPHRQFVFTMPKALRPFFRHDRRLFAEVSRLIYTIISEFYAAAAGEPLLSGVIAAHQTFGDQLRWNPHHHCLVLEGGFDGEGRFVHVPLSGRGQMTEVFRRRLICLLVQKELLAEYIARPPLSLKNDPLRTVQREDPVPHEVL